MFQKKKYGVANLQLFLRMCNISMQYFETWKIQFSSKNMSKVTINANGMVSQMGLGW